MWKISLKFDSFGKHKKFLGGQIDRFFQVGAKIFFF